MANNIVTIVGEPGNSSAAGNNLVSALAGMLSNDGFAVQPILDSAVNDTVVGEACKGEILKRYGVNHNATAGLADGISNKFKRFIENEFASGSITVDQKKQAEDFIENYVKLLKETPDKKKQITGEAVKA